MTEIARLPADTGLDTLLEILSREGALILEDVLPREQVDRTLDELMPYVEATAPGHDDFSGRRTTRTGALVARSPASRELIMHPTILAAAERFLAPWCERIQLHLGQVIRIMPGQEAQLVHRDRWAWGTHLARDLEPQFNTIWALSPFRRENGATRVVPGSVDWPDARRPEPEEIRAAEMAPGSVLIYSGTVFHGGGANVSEEDRVGVNLTYTLGWLRQEENQYLSCPPEIARDLDPALQELLGYTLGNYALGYYTPPLPPGEGPEAIGPEYALGRRDAVGERFGSDELYESLTERLRATETSDA